MEDAKGAFCVLSSPIKHNCNSMPLEAKIGKKRASKA